MKPIVMIGLLTAAALLGGCNQEQAVTYEDYLKDANAARAKAKACSEMPAARAAIDVNCKAAQKAVGTRRPQRVEFGSADGR